MERDILGEIVALVNSERVFSDIHLQQDEMVMIKAPAGWVEVEEMMPPTFEDIDSLMSSLETDWMDVIKTKAINRPIDLSQWRLRINAYLSMSGKATCLSIRKIPKYPPTLAELGLPASVNMMLDAHRGIVLIAGATGTGKTTSIAAIVDRINSTRNSHIVTVEDPIEFVMERKKAIFSQREIGVDVSSFYEGVRDAMRQRPDVIVIGEIRDKETADAALIAAESGHLVIASLHANSVVGAVQKMLGFFPSSERESKLAMLEGSLVGAIGQILLPSRDRKRAVLAAELMFNHKHQFSKQLGERDALQSAFDRSQEGLSRTFNQSMLELVRRKEVEVVDVLSAVVYNQADLHAQIQALGR